MKTQPSRRAAAAAAGRTCSCNKMDGKIYAIDIDGDVVVSTIENPTRVVTYLSNLLEPRLKPCDFLYLFKTDDDELLMVGKITVNPNYEEEEELVEEDLDNPYEEEEEFVEEDLDERLPSYDTSYGFELFKLDSNKSSWLRNNNLDDYAIFLRFNTSICISSKYLPNLKGNCIYYSDDQHRLHTLGYIVGHDFCVFNISDRSLQRILYEERPLRLFFWPQPIWVMLKCC